MRWLLVLLALPGPFACERRPRTDAEAGFRAFSDALRRRDEKAAWALVAEKSRAALQAKSKALHEASGGSIRDEPALLAFLTHQRPQPLLEVTTVEPGEARAVLQVKTCQVPLDERLQCPEGQVVQERVTMLKEAQRWAVELPQVTPP